MNNLSYCSTCQTMRAWRFDITHCPVCREQMHDVDSVAAVVVVVDEEQLEDVPPAGDDDDPNPYNCFDRGVLLNTFDDYDAEDEADERDHVRRDEGR